MKSCIRKQKIAYIACIALSVMLISQSQIHARTEAAIKMITVTGASKIRNNNDSAAAREAAINEGLFNAVGLAITELIPRELVVRHFAELNEMASAQAGKFVREYRVLAESKYQDTYRVLLEANVATDIVQNQLAAFGIGLGRENMPKVLVLMTERNIGDLEPRFWWKPGMTTMTVTGEQAIADALSQKGFSIISHAVLPPDIAEKASGMVELDTETAVMLGSHFGADMVVIGNSFAEPAPNTMGANVRSFKATVTARAVNVLNGQEIGATYQTRAGVGTVAQTGGQDVITQAATAAGEDLCKQLLFAQKKEGAERGAIQLVLKGNSLLTRFYPFREGISDIPGVGNIQTREMKIDQIVLLVDYTQKAQDLANAIMLKSFSGFGINISEVTDNTVQIELIPASSPGSAQTDGEETLTQ